MSLCISISYVQLGRNSSHQQLQSGRNSFYIVSILKSNPIMQCLKLSYKPTLLCIRSINSFRYPQAILLKLPLVVFRLEEEYYFFMLQISAVSSILTVKAGHSECYCAGGGKLISCLAGNQVWLVESQKTLQDPPFMNMEFFLPRVFFKAFAVPSLNSLIIEALEKI